VALLVRVRAGRNKTFDRLVFDFEGPAPDIRVKYVDHVAARTTAAAKGLQQQRTRCAEGGSQQHPVATVTAVPDSC
jgi:hypothetical protein